MAGKLPALLAAALNRRPGAGAPQSVQSGAQIPTGLPTWRLLLRLAVTASRRLLVNDQWRILLYRDQTWCRLETPWVELMPDERRFWADPFVVPHADGVAVFFEELPFASGKGRISVVDVDRHGQASAPVVALDEPWHLSYPFIFERHGRRYMIPESLANETVDLYECIDFPAGWRWVKTLIRGERLADATLIEWNGRLWMFVAHGGVGTTAYDELHIYWAEDLLGPWTPHALNPVKIDAGSARPAGAMFLVDGHIVRPTQDCRNRYGDNVSFQQVTTLD